MEQEPVLMAFQNLPFNGDVYIQEEFKLLKEKFNLTAAIETGSCLYVTTKWLGENFDKVFTAEINLEFAKFGVHRIENMPNVKASLQDSVLFLKELGNKLADEKCIFFLDAHWGSHCPLLEELEAISNIKMSQPPVIAIHDFFTGDSDLGYDEYNGQPFTYDWIENSMLKVETAFGCKYPYYFNEHAVGAKRGIIYLYPVLTENNSVLLTQNVVIDKENNNTLNTF